MCEGTESLVKLAEAEEEEEEEVVELRRKKKSERGSYHM